MQGGNRILLGVSGGIAAYKAADLARDLRAAGFEVRVVMTQAATRFISPLTFSALTGRPAAAELFEDDPSASPQGGPMAHIDLAAESDLLLVAPATANLMAKFATGLADDLLTTVHLAFAGPTVLAPAMNTRMWEHPATQANLAKLRGRGVRLVEPETGEMACGTFGPGRLAGTERIVVAVKESLPGPGGMEADTVLVTAGPTREAVDPVRFLSNRSSGRMGFALAAEAARRGARVVLVAGPVSLPTPTGCERIDVVSAREMHTAVMQRLAQSTIAVMAAAVSDFRPTCAADKKLKKQNGVPRLRLEETEDILRDAGRSDGGTTLVGFAAETDNLKTNALRKLETKRCDFVVANPVGGETGFDSEFNQGLLLAANGAVGQVGPMSKAAMAGRILDFVLQHRREKAA